MKPKYILGLLYLHVILLILASTRFTVLSWIWHNGIWTWDYFQYNFQNGWGYQYQSSYTLAVILTYIVAYLAGIIGCSLARKYTAILWNTIAIILSIFGLISFLIESTHWLWKHHLSLILSCPAAILLLVAIVIIQLCRSQSKPAEPIAALNANSVSVPPLPIN